MGKTVIKNAKVGIVLEAVVTGVDEPVAGVDAFEGDSYIGALYANNATRPYVVMSKPTDVTINTFGPIEETITSVEDDFEHDIHIRADGSGSFELVQHYNDAGSAIVDFRHLMYAAKNFPRGISNTANDTDAQYNMFDDNGTSRTTDRVGYAVIIETKTVLTNGNIKYFTFVFHNCKIMASPTMSAQKANRIRIEFRDARYIDGPTPADLTFTNHADA